MSEFLSRYPDSEYASHARQRMIYLKNLLAEHEIGIAHFYMERKAYVGAIGRANYVMEHLPNTPQTPEALSILIKCYEIIGYEKLMKENIKILKLNYPDYVSTNILVRDKKSWINRLSLGLLGGEKIPMPKKR